MIARACEWASLHTDPRSLVLASVIVLLLGAFVHLVVVTPDRDEDDE